ncbi:MAG: GNAT family N-acetyltransferase [Pirellulales bacterium]|nr:GNAT family N-acetyltransferase [Pirellulales bacterium]
MGLTYFKRYRMEIDLVGRDLSLAKAPEGYQFIAWEPSLVDAHAKVKYLSFRDEIDSHVFPCFTEFAGCQRLMHEIAHKPGFLPEATWLAVYTGSHRWEYCGTIQGIRDRVGMGSVQNLGILRHHRGRRLGTALLFRALEGFREAGLSRVHLEVTADNRGAIRLYRRLGFAAVKTVFKAAEVAYS